MTPKSTVIFGCDYGQFFRILIKMYCIGDVVVMAPCMYYFCGINLERGIKAFLFLNIVRVDSLVSTGFFRNAVIKGRQVDV